MGHQLQLPFPDTEGFKFSMPEQREIPIGNNQIRLANLTNVKVLVEWSDEIVSDFDSETGTVLEYTSGYILTVIPDQRFVYKDQLTIYLGSVTLE